MHICIYAYMHAYMYICEHIRTYALIYASIGEYTNICAHICIYARIYGRVSFVGAPQSLVRPT